MSPSLSRQAALILFLSVLAAAGVQAEDQIGVYFDTEATENCIRLDQFGIVDAYVLLLDPTAFGGVRGWECSVVMDDVAILGVTLAGLAVDADSGQTDFAVGLGVPLFGSVVHLATIKLMLTGQQTAFYLYENLNISSIDGSPVYVDGSDTSILIPLTPAAITGDYLVAGINAYQCFPEEKTWAELKTIYR